MPKKIKVDHPAIPVPKDLEEAANFLSSIAHEQHQVDKIQADLNEEIGELKTTAMSEVKPYEENISRLVEGLFAFAESRRDELTDAGKRKTVRLPTGQFSWRMTPSAVSIRNTELVLARLKELKLERFIRTKEEPDKEAMLKEQKVAKTVKGVSISQHEEFVVKPAELKEELTSNVNKLKKA